MNSPILNRDFSHPADGWYQIEPKGEHPNRAAGVVQVIDDEAAQSIVTRFNEDATTGRLRHGNEMLIDHEHFSDQPDQETRAYGWLLELQDRVDGIYARVRWTKTGREAVDGGDYRFFSTEYGPKDLQLLKAEGGKRKAEMQLVRPLRLGGLSLTNMNNNRGQKPITNRAPNGSADQPQQTKTMNTVAIKLGLAADASEEIVLAEVTRLLNRVTELIPHEEENKSLRDRLSAVDGEQVHTLLDLHGVKDEKIRNRLKPVLMGLKNREERVAELLDFGFKLEEHRSPERQPARLLNRLEGRQPRAEIMNLNEQALAQRAEAEIGDYKIRNRCTYAEARNAVRNARPELFGLEKK
ncbi:MAG TPA: phage protease [Verrucomicrobiae bacterium]|jgi:phage I-like protein|nr:phage protease [Verrucomicrobiae bacterium]